DAVHTLAEQKFGGVPQRAVAPHADPVAPPRLTETRMAFTSPEAKLPLVMRIYRVPSYTADARAAYSLELLAQVLGGGATTRMYRTLGIQRKIAVAAGAYYNGYARGPAEFGVYAYPAPGVSFDVIEAAIDDLIKQVSAAPPAGPEFARARTALVA